MPRVKFLFLGVNPPTEPPLKITTEFERIVDILTDDRRGAIRFAVESRWEMPAVRLPDLLAQHKPHVLHFSGHGTNTGELLFDAGDGRSQPADPDALERVLAEARVDLRCFIINACHSAGLAERLTAHVDVVIGMQAVIDDPAALCFAESFYAGLRRGESVGAAFELAKRVLEGSVSVEIPRLFERPGVDASKIFVHDRLVDPRLVKRRGEWLDDMLDRFDQLRPADPILRRFVSDRTLRDLLLPVELVPVDASGQPGIQHLSIVDIWDQTSGPLLITGEIGAGKSTALHVLAHELASRTTAFDTSPVPMMISATNLGRMRARRACRLGLTDLVPSATNEAIRLYLLVDGLDELKPKLLADAELCIRELARASFIARVVVVSRPRATLPRDLFSRYQMLPWSNERVREFAVRWGSSALERSEQLTSGNPLTVTLACAYASRVEGGLLKLLDRVVEDLRRVWQSERKADASESFDDELVEDCCLWLLLGAREKDISVSPRREFDRVVEFLEREGLVCASDEPYIPAGARWVVEFLAARSCVRHAYDLEQLGGRIELAELAKVGIGLELELASERALERLERVFCPNHGRTAFRLRLATLATRGCALRGDDLPSAAAKLAVECLWRYVIDETSRWKSAVAAEALAPLCQSNREVANMIRVRVERVLACGNEDATELLAARDGLLHRSAAVRSAALANMPQSDLRSYGWFLHYQMMDQGHLDHPSVPLTAARLFRSLPREPDLEPSRDCIVSHLRAHDLNFRATAAAALRPDEAPFDDLIIGMQHLFEMGGCSEEIRLAFLAHPGGHEAAAMIRSPVSINGVSATLADGPSDASSWSPSRVPRYSYEVQRSCWRWLVPAIRYDVDRLAELAKRHAIERNPTALSAAIGLATQRPQALMDVFAEAAPWSLIVEETAVKPLSDLLVENPEIHEAFLDYLERGAQAKHTGHIRLLQVLEPLLERDLERSIFVGLLGLAWSSPMGSYMLSPQLIKYPEIADLARRYVDHIINQVDGPAERTLVPIAAAGPLLGAAWFRWEGPEVIQAQLERWLERGADFAQLVAALLPNMPAPIVEAIGPTLESYLARPIAADAHGDAMARGLMFGFLPLTSYVSESTPALADAHARMGTTGSLAAVAALCRFSPPERCVELSKQAAQQRLHVRGFPDDEVQAHLEVVVPFAREQWRQLARQQAFHPIEAAPIFEALLATSTPSERSRLAHEVWEQMRFWWTPYRSTGLRDLVGYRPADLAHEWLFRFADAQRPEPIEGDSEPS